MPARKVDIACAVIAPGDAKALATTDLNEYHCAHGHPHEVLLSKTAKQGVVLTEGPLKPYLGCSMAKGIRKPIANMKGNCAPLPPGDEEGGGSDREGESVGGASSQGGGGGEKDFDEESCLDVTEGPGPAPRASPEEPALTMATGNGTGEDVRNVPPTPASLGGRVICGGGGDPSELHQR